MCYLVDCGSLEDPVDGQVNFVETFGGSVANYSCDESYVLCGSESRLCQLNGSWSGSPPDCISTLKNTLVSCLHVCVSDVY